MRLNELLRTMVDEKVHALLHGSEQPQRGAGAHHRAASSIVAVFTNITHDHLDYHGTFAEYIKAKKRFFDQLGSDATALGERR